VPLHNPAGGTKKKVDSTTPRLNRLQTPTLTTTKRIAQPHLPMLLIRCGFEASASPSRRHLDAQMTPVNVTRRSKGERTKKWLW